MSIRRKIEKEEGLFFITITCFNWIPLFEIADAYYGVFNWFDALRREGNQIAGYVIMPNHLHVLIHFSNTSKSVNQFVSNGKRFMAYEIVNKLKEKNKLEVLTQLQKGVNKTQQNLGKKHEVFEPSFECKRCSSNDFTIQKLNYIHNNPVKGKWKLSENAVDYKYSSLHQYETGQNGIYPVTLLSFIEIFSFL